jgi:predicted metal-dependent hydrolase
MNRETSTIEFGVYSVNFTIIRRKRKTLEIAVEPDASVVVKAPLGASVDTIRGKVRKRASWIRRQQQFFLQFAPKTPPRRYVAGETHLYLGRQYRLKVLSAREPAVKLTRGFIMVYSRAPKRTDVTRDLVNAWYRSRAQVWFRERLSINLLRFPNPERVQPCGLTIRSLRQRWGSMSPKHTLLLNQRLIQAPVDSIDYVITHELCHVAQPHYGPLFFKLLNRVLPDWERRKQRLEDIMS